MVARLPTTTPPDTRLAYGASCTWFGPIQEVGTTGPHKLPCCPCCRNMLFEMPTHETWWKQVDVYEAQGHTGYRAMLQWQREQKRCYPLGTPQNGVAALARAYRDATGIEVPL